MLQELIDAIQLPKLTGNLVLPHGAKIVPDDVFNGTMRDVGLIECESIASLIDYTREQHRNGTVIFASLREMAITSVIDWHTHDLPGDADHQARYPLKVTSELQAWLGINNRPLNQASFAEFIEEHLDDIHSPSPADVLTAANSLSGKRNVSFKSVNNLANGDRSLVWEENTEAKGAGDIRVPSEIVIRIPIFKGAEEATMFEIRALFRYRITDGKLSFEVKLLHVDRIQDMAFAHLVSVLRVGLKDSYGEMETPPIYEASIKETPFSINKKYIHTNP